MRPPLSAWVTPRAGLVRSLEALARGPARIAYLGLSVTAHRPVLCFVECTTGDIDGKTALADVPGAVEGVVRKLAAVDCEPCLLHLYRREQSWRTGHPVLREYERVADHYGIPSINVARRIEEDVVGGRADVDVLFRDVVHTTDAGSRLTADLVAQGLAWIRQHGAVDETPAPAFDRPRCAERRYDRARLHDAEPWYCIRPPRTGRFRLMYPYVELDPSNAIRFQDPAAALKGLFVIVGPSSGMIRVSTPSGDLEYQLMDEWCHYDRISTVVFADAIPAGTPVTIRQVRTASSSPAASRDQDDGPCLRVMGFLCLPGGAASPAPGISLSATQ